MICSSFSAVVYPVGLVWLRVCRISRTVAGPRSHKTRKMASSPSVGRGGLDGMTRLLTNCFVNVNENFRHFARRIFRGLFHRSERFACRACQMTLVVDNSGAQGPQAGEAMLRFNEQSKVRLDLDRPQDCLKAGRRSSEPSVKRE